MTTIHNEDVKAAIRKQYASVAEFERLEGLPPKSVYDLFRGRGSRRVREAVEQVIGVRFSPPDPRTHHLNVEAL